MVKGKVNNITDIYKNSKKTTKRKTMIIIIIIIEDQSDKLVIDNESLFKTWTE